MKNGLISPYILLSAWATVGLLIIVAMIFKGCEKVPITPQVRVDGDSAIVANMRAAEVESSELKAMLRQAGLDLKEKDRVIAGLQVALKHKGVAVGRIEPQPVPPQAILVPLPGRTDTVYVPAGRPFTAGDKWLTAKGVVGHDTIVFNYSYKSDITAAVSWWERPWRRPVATVQLKATNPNTELLSLQAYTAVPPRPKWHQTRGAAFGAGFLLGLGLGFGTSAGASFAN